MFKPSAVQPAANETTEPKAETASQVIKTETEQQSVKTEPLPEKEIQEKVEETQHTSAQNNQVQNSSTDIAQIWQGILQNIESIPSRMFFYNLSRPVELTPEGITISFAKDIFCQTSSRIL